MSLMASRPRVHSSSTQPWVCMILALGLSAEILARSCVSVQSPSRFHTNWSWQSTGTSYLIPSSHRAAHSSTRCSKLTLPSAPGICRLRALEPGANSPMPTNQPVLRASSTSASAALNVQGALPCTASSTVRWSLQQARNLFGETLDQLGLGLIEGPGDAREQHRHVHAVAVHVVQSEEASCRRAATRPEDRSTPPARPSPNRPRSPAGRAW